MPATDPEKTSPPVPENDIVPFAESLFQLGDIMEQIRQAVVMYRQSLLGSGFSDLAVDSMCVSYHNTIVALAFQSHSSK